MKRYYTVCPTDELRQLCIDNDWFTQGSIRQYEKLFERNRRYSEDEPLALTSEIIAIIWVCSDASIEEITKIVSAKQDEYCTRIFTLSEEE